MTKDDKARVALGLIVGGIAAVALTKNGLSHQQATLRWIAYCVVAGVVINSQRGMNLRDLLVAASLSALGLVLAILWMSLLGRGELPDVSGAKLDFNRAPAFSSAVVGGLLFVSTFGVTVGGFARPATLDLLQRVAEIDLEKAKRIEAFLKVLVSICGVAALFLL
jgi:hypothetical protein